MLQGFLFAYVTPQNQVSEPCNIIDPFNCFSTLSATRPHLAYLSAKGEEYSRCNTRVENVNSLSMYLDYFARYMDTSGLSPEQPICQILEFELIHCCFR